MSKSICFGNPHLLIALDRFAQVYDVYYPHVGLENHTMGKFVHKMGVWVENRFSWFDDGTWQFEIDYENNTMISNISAFNSDLEIKINFQDGVYNEKDIFIRQIRVINLSNRQREVRFFTNHQFQIYESFRGDTAIYDHEESVIFHYKGDRVFLINCLTEDGIPFTDYSIGLLGIEGKEGTFKDAEDGLLSQNNVEHGIVDSVIGHSLHLPGAGHKDLNYWIIFEKTIPRAKAMNKYVLERGTSDILISTRNYWKAWLTKHEIDFLDLDQKYIDLFQKSLLLIDTHIGGNGTIIASGDSDLLKNGRGTYSYMWPRDGALVVLPMIGSGYYNIAKRFFEFSAKVITDQGYMLHKYRSDATLGSSWHPWVRDCQSELPIQEDETALVLYALGKYYEATKDLEFIEEVYENLILRPAEFMINYLDSETNLPKPTYDLWEEKFGVSTFTASTVYGGLLEAHKFASLLGKNEPAQRYLETAEKIKKAILKYLWDEELGAFVKLVNFTTEGLIFDRTIDMSSIHGVLEFGVLPANNPKITKNIETIINNIECKTEIGGIARYEDDYYFRVSKDTPGNPWIITSLWLARYYLEIANNLDDLALVYEWLDWVLEHSQKSGVLSEQINPFTGEQISATPLTWSQAEYVQTILALIKKIRKLKGILPSICYVETGS